MGSSVAVCLFRLGGVGLWTAEDGMGMGWCNVTVGWVVLVELS